MFVDPVSFSDGLMTPPSEYFPAIRKVLETHGVQLVADEVITGFGRTGRLFGSETFALEPDNMTLAKSITGGYFPLSVAVLGKELYRDLEQGSDVAGTLAHAATFAAHPVGAAAALKTIEIIERDGLVAHARRMGEQLRTRLEELRDHPLVGDVRSVGLAGAVDFLRRDADDRPINADECEALSARVFDALLGAGVVGRNTGRSLVIAPPLIVQQSEIDEICDRLARALDAVL